MHQFPGNWNPTLFTLSAVAIGTLFLDDFTPNEQNSIGNWLIMTGQTILTNAAQAVLIKGRQQNGYEDPSITGINHNYHENKSDEEQLRMIKEAVRKIEEQLSNLR